MIKISKYLNQTRKKVGRNGINPVIQTKLITIRSYRYKVKEKIKKRIKKESFITFKKLHEIIHISRKLNIRTKPTI